MGRGPQRVNEQAWGYVSRVVEEFHRLFVDGLCTSAQVMRRRKRSDLTESTPSSRLEPSS